MIGCAPIVDGTTDNAAGSSHDSDASHTPGTDDGARESAGTATGGTSPNGSGAGTTGATPTPNTSSGTGSGGDSSDPEDDGGCLFLCEPDGGTEVDFECDPWLQDCPPDERCSPWANDGGDTWNATRCVPLAPHPDAAGDPCLVEGNHASGIDTCDAQSLCFGVDDATLAGTCRAHCSGSAAAPTCPTGSQCLLEDKGGFAVCLPQCNPLTVPCADDGDRCTLLSTGAFACVPAVTIPHTSECTEVCAPGSACYERDGTPRCAQWCDRTAQVSGCTDSQTCLTYDPADPNGSLGICVDVNPTPV